MRVADLHVGLLSYFVGTRYVYAVLVDQRENRDTFRLTAYKRALPLVHELLDSAPSDRSGRTGGLRFPGWPGSQ
jgi:hypothetical protein